MTHTEFSIERTLFKDNQLCTIENFIKSSNWEELAKYLQQNCGEHVVPEIYPSDLSLSTKTFIDNLAIHSLKGLFNESQKRGATLQGQLDANNRTIAGLNNERNQLQRKLKEVEARMRSVNTNIQKQSRELTDSTRVQENFATNIHNFQASLKKNEPALKKWQQTLQTDFATWSKEDITFLLKETGLARYCGSFLSNNIDGAVLLQLETNDLISALEVSFKDAKKLLMYIYLIRTHHDIYTIPPGVLQWNNDTVCTWLEDNKFGHLVDVFKKNEVCEIHLGLEHVLI